MTNEQARIEADARTMERYRKELADGTLFRYLQQSEESRYGGRSWIKVPDHWTANAMIVLGRMAQTHRPLLDVAMAMIGGLNPHSSVKEWGAKLAEIAGRELSSDWMDVQLKAGPEPGRPSSWTRPYTLAERLIVLVTIRSLMDDWTGPGWCAERLAQELEIAHFVTAERLRENRRSL